MANGESTENFYEGANYGLNPDQGNFLGMSYRTPVSQIGLATDARTANQIQATTDKLSTGGKVIEVQMTTPNVAEAIPNQHLEEINRLKKLTGASLTLHGPIVEPTGITKQGWDESHREQAERQMAIAVDRAHKLEPDGNIVVTFHSSVAPLFPETKVIDEKTGEEKLTEFMTVNERTGQFGSERVEKDFLSGITPSQKDILNKRNKEAWFRSLQGINFHAQAGADAVEQTLRLKEKGKDEMLEFYKLSNQSPEEAEKQLKKIGGIEEKEIRGDIQRLTYGEIYLRDAYQDLQNLFNQAYDTAQKNGDKEDLKKLDRFKDEIGPKLKSIEDPSSVGELAQEVLGGIRVLKSISTPQTLKPLRGWTIDKSAETFANLALKGYNKFGDTSPIISIENPPAGTGLYTAEDLRDLIKETRKKFKDKAVASGTSESEAEKQAEKLIGATWDIGHINMLRKYGYGEEHLLKQTETLKPYIKHVHLSDNFGMEHTELPMGMGNVPTKKHMEIIDKYNKQVKKIIETGDWFQHFQTPPFVETLSAMGSSIYPMAMGPYWNQVAGASGGYFVGQGQIIPDINFQTYGAGFSNLPVELGGQMSGRNRLSGTPME